MKCSTCRIESNDLRVYQPLASAGTARHDAATLLCPACRVQNSLHPRYVPVPQPVRADAARIAASATGRSHAEVLALHPH